MSDSFFGMTLPLVLHNGRIVEKIPATHLSSERLAAFLDGRLTPADRSLATRHFAECSACRHELAELRLVLDSARRPDRTRWFMVGVALAAAIGFAVVLPRVMRDELHGIPADVERVRTVASAAPTIVMQDPANGAVLDRPVKLSWQSTGSNASYLVVVLDSAGGTVFRADVIEESLILPDSTRLARGGRYFWRVDARFFDGRSARTEARAFTIR
jgi:hypothetical protein